MSVARATIAERKQFILDHFETMQYKDMAVILGCSATTISLMARKMKLCKHEKLKRYIRENYMTMRNEDIAEKFRCTPSLVCTFASEMGLFKSMKWDNSCDLYLLKKYKTMKLKELASNIGCSEYLVNKALRRLGIIEDGVTLRKTLLSQCAT